MGNLVKDTPFSEITATLEVLDQHGVGRADLKKIRTQRDYAKRVCDIILGSNMLLVSNWLLAIVVQELKAHFLFFGNDFDLTPYTETLKHYGRKQVNAWLKLGLEPHFLPKVVMANEATFPGWEVKPEEWLYTRSAAGKIFRFRQGELTVDTDVSMLEGITVLIDSRLKPAYAHGMQMYQDDNFLGPILERLRQQRKIQAYNPANSRFNISSSEWEESVKPEVAKLLGLEINQIRLERGIEGNVIPQLYPHMPRKNDGTTDTWEWREEFFKGEGDRLRGGHSGHGGLADVGYYDVGYHWHNQAVRPLAVL